MATVIRRHLEDPLLASLRRFPVVLLQGARQVGKSTLAMSLSRDAWPARYFSLDDRTVLDAALTNPDGFLREASDPVILDEVQRAPDLLRAVKLAVDQAPRAGRFFLTASANVANLPAVADALRGRVAIHELHPLAWTEGLGGDPSPIVNRLFQAKSSAELLDSLPRYAPPERIEEIRHRILTGGFPVPAAMAAEEPRRAWFESYRQTYIERDLRNLANLQNLPDFNRLMTTLALRTSQILNLSELARDVGLPVTTVRRYFHLLEQTYQVGVLRPCSSPGGKRLVKRPKVYVHDTGMACHLGAVDDWQDLERRSRVPAMVETWIQSELRKLLALSSRATELSYWRAQPGREVDFLLERDDQIVGIEAKWSGSFSKRDLVGLANCRESFGSRWRLGVLLHGGAEAVALDPFTVALPFGVFFGREGRGPVAEVEAPVKTNPGA